MGRYLRFPGQVAQLQLDSIIQGCLILSLILSLPSILVELGLGQVIAYQEEYVWLSFLYRGCYLLSVKPQRHVVKF